MIFPQIERDLLKLWRSIKKSLPLFFVISVVLSPLLLVLEADGDLSDKDPSPPAEHAVTVGIPEALKIDGFISNKWISNATNLWFDDKRELFGSLSVGDIDYAVTSNEFDSLQLHLGKQKRIEDALDDRVVSLFLAGTTDQVVISDSASKSASYNSSPNIAWAGFVAIIVFISIVSSFLVWEERSMGYLEELIASPASHLSIMVSKLLAVLIAVGAGILLLAIFALIITAGITWFGGVESVSVQQAVESSGAGGSALSISTVVYMLSVLAGVSSVAAILVIIQLTIRDRMVISLVTLSFNVPLFFLPLLIPVISFENASWAWMIPVINIYGDLAFAMQQGDAAHSFFPAMMVNVVTLCAVVTAGAFSVGRIKDWPAR